MMEGVVGLGLLKNDDFVLLSPPYKTENDIFSNEEIVDLVYNDTPIHERIFVKQLNKGRWNDLPKGLPPYYISRKIHNILKDNNVTGWFSRQLSVLGYQTQEIQNQDYLLLGVTGRCGGRDTLQSPIIFKKSSPAVVVEEEFYDGFLFDLTTWTGDDIFLAEDTYFHIVTQRVKDLFEENEIVGVEFTNVKDFELLIYD